MSAPAICPQAPAQVLELDLDRPNGLRRPGAADGSVDPDGPVLALVRRHGHPLGLVTATVTAGDLAGLRRALTDAALGRLDLTAVPAPPPAPGPDPPFVSVIVCTRDRADMLGPCLDALIRTSYPNTEIIVVDNAPSTDATATLIRSHYRGRVRYLREPVAGLARARNSGLTAAHGEICAFTDDDAVVDEDWVAALVEAFRADQRIGCVTGLVLPAELDTEAQAMFERYGGFSRGFTARRWTLGERSKDPLFPFAVSRFGTGASMAFRTHVLRTIGGFDPATGTGTPSRGGEDLLAFLSVLTGGHSVAYQPDAIIWHRHRRTMEALTAQVYGFGVGFGAYLTAAVTHRPALLAALLRRVPRGVWQIVRRGRSGPAEERDSTLARLGRQEFLGLLHGPFSYLVSVRRQHVVRAGVRP